jgi:hypothetical protein
MSSSWDEPTSAQLWYLQQAESRVQGAIVELNRIFAEDVTAFRAKVEEAGLSFLEEKEPLSLHEGGE